MIDHHCCLSILLFRYIPVIGLTCGVIALLQLSVEAHDYWFEQEGQEYVLYRGHHFGKHEGDFQVPYDPAIIQHITCVSPKGIARKVDPPISYPARMVGPCARLTVELDSGYWPETGIKTFKQHKEQVPDALYTWHAIESTTLLHSWTQLEHPLPLPQGLEIFFEKNPFLVEKGEKLRLIVLLAGKPCQGVTVAYDGNPRGVTGQDGRINVRVRHGGLQFITGSIKGPADNMRKSDMLLRSTTLMFHLPDGPEE